MAALALRLRYRTLRLTRRTRAGKMSTEIVMVDPATLQRYSLFGGLTVEQIESIRPLLGQEGYAAGEAIINEGEANDRIRFVMEGRVAVTRAGRLIIEIGEGETFGEMEVLDVMPSVASVRATSPTLVTTISNKGLREMYKIDARVFALIIMNLARDLSRRLRRMDELACANQQSEAVPTGIVSR